MGYLFHYMWCSLKKVYACSPYRSTPPTSVKELGHHYTISAYYRYTVALYIAQALTRKIPSFEQVPGNEAMYCSSVYYWAIYSINVCSFFASSTLFPGDKVQNNIGCFSGHQIFDMHFCFPPHLLPDNFEAQVVPVTEKKTLAWHQITLCIIGCMFWGYHNASCSPIYKLVSLVRK